MTDNIILVFYKRSGSDNVIDFPNSALLVDANFAILYEKSKK